MSAIPVIREPLPGRLRHRAQPSGTRLGPFDSRESTGRYRSGPRPAISGASRQRMTPDGPRTTVPGSGVPPAECPRWSDETPAMVRRNAGRQGRLAIARFVPGHANGAPRWAPRSLTLLSEPTGGQPWRSRLLLVPAGTGVTNPIAIVTPATARRMSIKAKPGLLVSVGADSRSVGGGVSPSG